MEAVKGVMPRVNIQAQADQGQIPTSFYVSGKIINKRGIARQISMRLQVNQGLIEEALVLSNPPAGTR